MKKTLIVITLFLMIGSLSAQDKIYFNDGSTIEAKVLVVSESKVQYKSFWKPSGIEQWSQVGVCLKEYRSTLKYLNKRPDIQTDNKLNTAYL